MLEKLTLNNLQQHNAPGRAEARISAKRTILFVSLKWRKAVKLTVTFPSVLDGYLGNRTGAEGW